MEEKFSLVLELFYIPTGSKVKKLLTQKEYIIHDEIVINDPGLRDIKTITPWKESRFLVPLGGSGNIESAGMKEKFILENLSKNDAISIINRIDMEFL